MKFAIVESGIVTNIALAEAPLGDNWIAATDAAEIGGTWDGTSFAPRPLPAVTAQQVTAERDRRMTLLAADYSATERETWPVQVEEARAVKADPAAPTPMLTPLAAARGLTVDQMADRVLGLNAAFAAATGQIMAAATVLRGMDPIPADYTADTWWQP